MLLRVIEQRMQRMSTYGYVKKNFERTEFGEDIDYNETEKMHEN